METKLQFFFPFTTIFFKYIFFKTMTNNNVVRNIIFKYLIARKGKTYSVTLQNGFLLLNSFQFEDFLSW